ncbi:MAG TPA: acyl-CoA dehydrogenase family protein [Blastocatellia bacterium]|jgi:butyryl-CoA dehydrogenase|nr:acyl-CoA dehydrogenase family protein [Blastocatellia bacterium]
MNFELTDAQRELVSTIRRYCQEELAPAVTDHLEREEQPNEAIAGLASLGVFGLPYPEEYSGTGAGMTGFALALEEIAAVSPSVAAVVFAHSSPATLIYLNGTESQKQRWLVPLVEGRFLGAIGMTEPGGGSDIAALRTRAHRDGGDWVLNGSKTFITNTGSTMSGVTVVAARAPGGISSFIVPADARGFKVGRHLRKIGWRAAETCEIFLDDCRLPNESLLGKEGEGHRQMLTAVTYGRICVGAIAVGLARACYELAARYSKERTAFGKAIASRQAVAFKLVDMSVSIEAARLLTLRAATLADTGRAFRAEASMAKLFASEAAFDSARQAIQIHGAYGISREYPVSWLLGEAKVLEIVEGTSEIQRGLLARLLNLTERDE